MSENFNLTPVEHELMAILWKIGKGTVRDVMAHLSDERDLAYTSVSTILRILQQKGIVLAEKAGKMHIYEPAFSKQKFTTYSVKKIVTQVFDGSAIQLVSHLVNKKGITKSEIAELERILAERKKELA